MGLLTISDVQNWLDANMQGKDAPTAIFSLNQRTSVFLLQALKAKKLRVPEDVALVGFDDFELASMVTPPLTTVAQSASGLVRRAMGLLLAGIQAAQEGIPHTPVKILLPTTLVIRSSCSRFKE